MTSVRRKKKAGIPWRALLKGVGVGLLTSFVLILLLTLLLYLGWLKESSIGIFNTVIKIVAAVAVGLAVTHGKHRAGWIMGGIAAAAAQLLAWTGMSVYLGAFHIAWSLLADLLMSFAIGSASAALLLKLTKSE